jgi:hypothetical protein
LNPATLSATGANTYSWSNGMNSQNIVVSVSTTSVFTVMGTGSNGCSKTDSITLVIKPLPIITVTSDTDTICEGRTSSLTVSGANSYIWNTTDTNTTIVVSPSLSTTYSVSGIGSNGCSNSTSFLLTVSACTGISELVGSEKPLHIYPNPTHGIFYINSSASLKLKMLNSLGQIVKTIVVGENNIHVMDITEMSNGIYFIVAEDQHQLLKQKIILTK